MSSAAESEPEGNQGTTKNARDIELGTVQKCFRKHQSDERAVDRERIANILRELNLFRDDYMKKFERALKDNSNQLDLYQFTQILDRLCGVSRVEATTSTLRAAFDAIDTGRDGFISRRDLKAAAELLDLNEGEIKKMMRSADTDKDGKVDFGEFQAMFGHNR
ncbi:putative calmodulin-like protein 6 [Galendromus occidentalis]|uniref:Calmodulin-like protein 6 n=1 Tax=Galendromus occidentalis TaxID=34638 RepID=A0AAJ6W082_9ACAR|nr:putative calmodulin-like protein 6 [Galendromus occidentalis]